ncbi:DUF5776 domain-containing protein [Bacillus sp. mrc49]|uniref:DUF5776 domain-containing protein n=1 Tax=Bacillus sp. mrc49 TaxID=2054913 RepID=UPI000C26DD9A|nr:DUF5776 domain-containing protein [Bacillus sp. mrc49]PJN90604.1 hypothetical protein CVN76_09410 [Bacillus sp. mrc49]
MEIRKDIVSAAIAGKVTYGKVNSKKSITIHETDNPGSTADADAHARLQKDGNTRSASWHWTVDDKESVQSFDHSYACWAGGTTKGNTESIHVEICVNEGGNYKKAVENAAKLVKKIMKDEGISILNVYQHNHWSGKNCPSKMRSGKYGYTWKTFIELIQSEESPTDSASPTDSKTYKVKKGDTLYSISKNNDLTVDQLKALNSLKSDVLSVGQALKLKVVAATTPKEGYFTDNPKKVQLKSNCTLYTSAEFSNKTKSGVYKKGEVFSITAIKYTKTGTPRLLTKSGFYLTANKNYVKKYN